MITKGSDRNPEPGGIPSQEENIKLTPQQKEFEESIRSKVKQWQSFRSSHLGRAALAIAEENLKLLTQLILLPSEAVIERRNCDPSMVNEVRAEWRGMTYVWSQILHEPEMLFRQEAELKKRLDKV